MKRFCVSSVFVIAFYFAYVLVGNLIKDGFLIMNSIMTGTAIFLLSEKFENWVFNKDESDLRSVENAKN